MIADGTPEERAELLQWCEQFITTFMAKGAPPNPRAKVMLARLLRMAGLSFAPASQASEGMPAPLAAIDLYEAMLQSAPFCFRDGCKHNFAAH